MHKLFTPLSNQKVYQTFGRIVLYNEKPSEKQTFLKLLMIFTIKVEK